MGDTPKALKRGAYMARFTNYATLRYSGGTKDSNVVSGELLETLSLTKTAVRDSYGPGERVTYVAALVNSGTTAIGGLTLTDDLGGDATGAGTQPLSYVEESFRYYVNGAIQTGSVVTAGPPLSVTGLSVPAGGNALVLYETLVTEYAPLGQEATITNTATLTGDGLADPLTGQAVIAMELRPELSISKGICPGTVTENGTLTYTFVIENSGAVEAGAEDEIVVTDVFNPKLSALTVTLDGAAWTEGTEYTYDTATGQFQSVAGQITVPAATYTENQDGTWKVTPGTTVLVIQGTV